MTTSDTAATKAQFGMIGMAVMGSNLALNMADHGFTVAVWNKETEAVDSFMAQHGASGKFVAARTIEAFTASIERPRRIMMMIKAGAPVDMVIQAIQPLLEPGDVLIDGGNSWFKDTQRREADLKPAGIHFIGSGVSGGEEGARFGPSLMPGGAREAYEKIRPVFEQIAAKTESGPCVTYCGPDGAGHFVKTVHNGIEYGDMQLIAETYDILRRVLGMEVAEISDVFARWNEGDLQSFLIEITSQILTVRDEETGKPLVDVIMDQAGQKGTGKWTDMVALDVGVPIPTIAAAIDARDLSGLKAERIAASKKFTGPEGVQFPGDRQEAIQAVHDALLASKICSYAQGMCLIGCASGEHHWGVDLQELARIWKGGCIIRARFLDSIMDAYRRRPDLPNLLMDENFCKWVSAAQPNWRKVVVMAHQAGVPILAMGGSLSYFDSYRTACLPQNLTQAQRDLFGAHTYQRSDHPERGFIHTDWLKLIKSASGG
ncbi:MAG: decarboxylating NADP(+)-dependent phosphogluconate dehydrogenase [Chloroflexi bacterium]|nr:decarboxylating NADP(+)-dependent phosphogluconate dehydrogenase [Chloroflexota bacterium]